MPRSYQARGVLVLLALQTLTLASPSYPYYSRSWIQVTDISVTSGTVTWLSPLDLPALDITAGVYNPGEVASTDDQANRVYRLAATGPFQVQISFNYGHDFELATHEYASATSVIQAYVDGTSVWSWQAFYYGAWQYEGWPVYSWTYGPQPTLTLTGNASSSRLTLNLQAWAFYDQPCGPPIPGPAALGLCLAGVATTALARVRRLL